MSETVLVLHHHDGPDGHYPVPAGVGVAETAARLFLFHDDILTATVVADGEELRTYERAPGYVHEPCPSCARGVFREVAESGSVVLLACECGVTSYAQKVPA